MNIIDMAKKHSIHRELAAPDIFEGAAIWVLWHAPSPTALRRKKSTDTDSFYNSFQPH